MGLLYYTCLACFYQYSSKKCSSHSTQLQLHISKVFLNVQCGDKLKLQEVQFAVPHTLDSLYLHVKESENYGKSLNIGLRLFRNGACLER